MIKIDLDQRIYDLLLEKSAQKNIPVENLAASLLTGHLLGEEISRKISEPSPENADQDTRSHSEDLDQELSTILKSFSFNHKREENEGENLEPEEGSVAIFTPDIYEKMEQTIYSQDIGSSSIHEKLQPVLRSLVEKGPLRSMAPIPEPEVFEQLGQKFPNFLEVVEKIRTIAMISRINGKRELKIRPILLAGPPGIGKSAFLKALAHILGVPISFMDCSIMTGGQALSGLSLTWKSGDFGPVMKKICLGSVANPIFVLDEIDKGGRTREYATIYDVLHGILEPVTSREFVDEALGQDFPFNASYATWIATCNKKEDIPDSLLSRFLVFDIQGPSEEEMTRSVVPSIMETVIQDMGLNGMVEPISPETSGKLALLSPREVKKVLELAIERSVRRGMEQSGNRTSIRISPEDILLPKMKTRAGMGFVTQTRLKNIS